MRKHISKKKCHDTHSATNLPPLAILKLFFFRKKTSILSEKKHKISNVLRNFTISVAVYSKYATIWRKTYMQNWQTSG